MEPIFFKTEREFRRWLVTNHRKQTEIVVGLHKKGYADEVLTSRQATDQALCFGWINGLIKGIDTFSYLIRFIKRKPKSVWSAPTIKRFQELAKQGRVHDSGQSAFNNRDKTGSVEKDFSRAQLALFKKNKTAWKFFESQAPSYQRYMTIWVTRAKRPETQAKRLADLIHDSGNGTKLRRILDAQEKVRKVYPEGKTPIETGKNLGIVTGGELRSVGIATVEELQSIGWEDAFLRLIETHPDRINLNMLTALIGAVENVSARKMDPALRERARRFLKRLRSI